VRRWWGLPQQEPDRPKNLRPPTNLPRRGETRRRVRCRVPEGKASWEFDEGAEIAQGRTIVEPLGGGRRYEVYLVWDERLLFLAVAKILRPDRVRDPSSVEKLRREAGMLERLAHPVLVRGFGAVFDGPHPHVLVEYLDGPNLRRLIRKHGALPLEQLAPVALNVASVLHYLAAEGVVHLDVKPANVVLGMPGRLIDLGSARTLSEAAGLRGTFGSPRYMAPEQRAPAGDVGPAADVWGLAATIVHAATGELPDLELDPASLARQVPHPLQAIVAAMLARAPADRPSAAEVAEALETI